MLPKLHLFIYQLYNFAITVDNIHYSTPNSILFVQLQNILKMKVSYY